MTYTIRVADTDIAFPCDAGTTILEAARLAGYEMPYSCLRGACASCRGLVRSGEVETPYPEDIYILFCQTKPKSDLEIVPREIRRIDPAAKSAIDARVLRVTEAADDVRIVQLRFPPGVRVKFKAGQYLDVILARLAKRRRSRRPGVDPPYRCQGDRYGRYQAARRRLDGRPTLTSMPIRPDRGCG